jgi:hypothetical protein
MQKGTHDEHSHHSTKTDNHNPSHEKIEVIDQQQVISEDEKKAVINYSDSNGILINRC